MTQMAYREVCDVSPVEAERSSQFGLTRRWITSARQGVANTVPSGRDEQSVHEAEI